jgi:choice-of-anchor B domain-containing protein
MRLHAHLDTAALAAAPRIAPLHGDATATPRLSGAGCWGYESPAGRRLALVGTSAGLAIVDVTEPARPHGLGLVDGEASPWREVKTYKHYAYVTTEAPTGLDIVDLADPERPKKVRSFTGAFDSAQTLWIDTTRGLLFANGTASGMHVLDLTADPENPKEVGRFDGFYVHDATTHGTTLFASAIRQGFLGLLDVTDPARMKEITHLQTGGGYTASACTSSNGRYLFTTDEVADHPLEAWDIGDPLHPKKVSEYIAHPNTIAHTAMIDGRRLLLAHYTEGVHLLDISDPGQLKLLGSYDTDPEPRTGYHGAVGAYIFPGSDLIVASDIEGGLFVLGYTGQ